MIHRRILPLLLATGLQVMPMLRAVLPLTSQGLAPSTWAIVLKLGAGAVALLGSYHAVSGATAIVQPYTVNATVGVRYNRQLGTSGQTAHSWSANTAPLRSAVYPLTPGLFLTNSNGKIGGIPTWAGTSNIIIKAWENTGNSGASVSATFVFRITNSSTATPPAITQQPQSLTLTAGQAASFTVVATGTAPLSYFWRKGTTVVQSGASAGYSLASAQTGDAGTYSVIVSNSAGTVTSANATLTVNPAITPPAITAAPTNRTVIAGSNATFTVTAGGTAPLRYRWQFAGTNIDGGTNATLQLSNVKASDAGTYTVTITNTAGSVSTSAVLTVLVPVAITAQPADTIVPMGSNATLSVTATGTSPAYRWIFNGSPVVGATASTLNLSASTPMQSGVYAAIVSNSVNSVTSAPARLLVVMPPMSTNAPHMALPAMTSGQFSVGFTTMPGYRYLVQYCDALGTTNWITMTNIPPRFAATNITLPQPVTNSPGRFYRVMVMGN